MTNWRRTRSDSRKRIRRHSRCSALKLEALEQRRLLASDLLGGVVGNVFLDANANGIRDLGEGVPDAMVQVYADTDGDGVFDAANDQLVGAATTVDAGFYRIGGLSTGDYFVVQPRQVAGTVSLAPQVSALTSVDGGGVAGDLIDSFQTLSDPVVDLEPSGSPTTAVTSAAEAIGGQRDLTAELFEVTGGVGLEQVEISAGNGLLATDPTNFAIGHYLIEWDGIDAAGSGLDPTGLGGVDLVNSGASTVAEGICIHDVNPDKAGLELVLRIYSDADNFSETTFTDLMPNTNQDLYVPFASFVAAGALGPADFMNVGAVTLEIVDAVDGTDFTLGEFGAVGPSVQFVDFLNAFEAPLVDIQALTNGNQADDPMDPDVPVVSAGSVVTWTYSVMNTGNVNITTVTVTDDQLGTITSIVDQGNGDAMLDPGETWVYEATGTAIDGSYSNLATVVVESDAAVTATDSDTSNYRGGVSSIDIEKLTNGNQADVITDPDVPMLEVGSSVTWTYLVTNTGSFDLANVAVTDNQIGVITNIIDNGDGDDILQPSESWTYQATGIAVLGEYENAGTANAVGQDQSVAADVDMSHYIGFSPIMPAIDVEVATNGVDADDPGSGPDIFVGDLVSLTYVVTNTGDVPLTNVQVADDNGTPADDTDDFFATFTGGDLDGDGMLGVDEAWNYQAFRVATLGDFETIGTATGNDEGGMEVTDSDSSNHRGVEHANGMFGWLNEPLISDVNDDGIVAGSDALAIINELVLHTVSDPVTSVLNAPPPTQFYDVNDDGVVAAADIIIVINDIGVAPSLDLNGPADGTDVEVTLPVNSTFVHLFDERLTIEHEGNSMLVSASLQIQGFVTTEEALDADTTDTSIAASFDDATGILTLTGADTLTNYLRVLRTVTLDLSTAGATRTPISVSVALDDGNAESNLATATVEREVVIISPTLDLNGSDDGTDVTVVLPLAATSVPLLDGRLTIEPGTSAELVSASLSIQGFVAGEEMISVDTTGTTITSNFDATTGILSLTGTDSIANYETVLQTAMLDLATAGGSRTPILVTVVVNDGTDDSNTTTVTVEREVVNIVPTLDLNGPGDGTDVAVVLPELATTVPLFDDRLTIEPGSATMLTSAALDIQGFVVGEEALAVDTTGTLITSVFDAATGVLTLSGTDTLANYESVLETAMLELTTAGGTRSPILIDVVLNDGINVSNTATATVEVTPPILDLNGPGEGTGVSIVLPETATTVPLFDDLLTIEPGSASMLASAVLNIQGFVAGEEALSIDTTGTSITSSFNATTGELLLAEPDSLENYEAVLRTVMLDLATAGGTRTPILIDIVVNDGTADSNTATATVNREGTAPTLEAIMDVTLQAGSPLHIPLVAADIDGDVLSFVATSDNPLVSTHIPSGNRSARISVSSPSDPNFVGGEMVFELFEQRAPRATQRIISLAQDGFYDNVIFHRVIDGFVIQGGDPTGTGSGGSSLGNFDDQYHPELQHNRSGVLSMAKSLDDTNDSQFFVTEVATRILDFQHTVFGQLITGEEVREEISNVDTISTDRPVNNVVIDSFEIFVDVQNGVLMLSAPEGMTGSAMITVTVSDGNLRMAQRTFNVMVEPDSVDNQPYLADIPQLMMAANSMMTFQLAAMDLEGDDVLFLEQDQLVGNELLQPVTSDDLMYFVDPNTGELTVVASNSLTGVHQFTVAVIQADQLNLPNRLIDLQVVEIVIG